jgi:NADH dehydrogenase
MVKHLGATGKRPHVVIIGAGFGGLWAARRLAGKAVEVTIIDRNNYHTFFPLLYQVGAAELEPEDIAYPVRSTVRGHRNVRFMLGEVSRVDLEGRKVQASGHWVEYDYLIVATGSLSNFFGVSGAQEYAYPLRTLDDGVALRNHVLRCFEEATHESNKEARRALLTFVIVGGGPTGVEFAGALSELIYRPMRKDYRGLDFREVKVALVEASDSLLSAFPGKMQAYALKRLRQIGVEVRLGSVVAEVTPSCVRLKDGTEVATRTVAWTAGVQGDGVVKGWGLPVGRGNRITVEPTLQVTGLLNVYAVGDGAMVGDGKSLPMVAPVAMQQGERASENILRQTEGQAPAAFEYKDAGAMAVIGRNAAVANLYNRWQFTGFPAWVVWLVVHLLKLIGFRNRLIVLTSWAWDYLFFERVVRLILPSVEGRGKKTPRFPPDPPS